MLFSIWKAASAALMMAQTARAATGSLSTLTFNVAGLPALLQSNGEEGDKTANTKLIGEYFSKYNFDVIHVQEDFNYHAALYAADTHPFRTATSGGAAIGSGLNTLANHPWLDFSRTKWATCSNDESADCLTPKGFTFMRMQVSPTTDHNTATFVDLYNLHTDAGISDADLVARSANINQVLDFADVWSAGNAVLILGDTNSRYSRARDMALRTLRAAGFVDPWVELARDGVVPTAEMLCTNPQALGNNTCETVDKLFYRASPLVALAADAFEYVGSWFLDANGTALSDHNPVAVNLTWTTGARLQQSGFWGGPHGAWFNDAPALASAGAADPVVTALTFRGAERLDSVAVTRSDGTRLAHGGSGGKPSDLALAPGEFWTAAHVCQGAKDGNTRLFSLLATTSNGNTLAAGTPTSDCADYTAPDGWAIVGFLGQAGDEIDQLAFLYAPQ